MWRSALINEDIGPSKDLNWVATIWTIGSAIGFLLVGRLSDIFGRKWMVMGTSILGLAGCIVGATAKNIDTLVGANLMNGIAAAGGIPPECSLNHRSSDSEQSSCHEDVSLLRREMPA